MTSTRFFSFPRARRRGQALILAVLVMLFAALLSSAFLVLVASNGRQIGREPTAKKLRATLTMQLTR